MYSYQTLISGKQAAPRGAIVAMLALLTALAAQEWPALGVVCLCIVAYSLLNSAKMNIAGPMFVLLIVFSLYVLPRASLVLLGVMHTFSGFQISHNNEWLVGIVMFVYALLFGNSLSGANKRQLTTPPPATKITKIASWMMLGLSLIFFIGYLNAIGGLQGLILNYSADTYFTATQDEVGSASKNASIYFLISGFSMLSASSFSSKGKAWGGLRYTLLSLSALVVAIAFIKREYAFDILLSVIVTLVVSRRVSSLRPLIIIGSCAAITLFLLFVVRSGLNISDIATAPVGILDTAEFWVFDQIVNVFQNGDRLIPSDYGWRHLLALISPFIPFDYYKPLDHILVERSAGITGWGIPPSIFGYALIVADWPGLIPYGLFLGLMLGTVDRWLKRSMRKHWIYLSAYMFFVMYCWFLFRNGDPVLAVFYTNRYLLLVLPVALTEYVLSKGRYRYSGFLRQRSQ